MLQCRSYPSISDPVNNDLMYERFSRPLHNELDLTATQSRSGSIYGVGWRA